MKRLDRICKTWSAWCGGERCSAIWPNGRRRAAGASSTFTDDRSDNLGDVKGDYAGLAGVREGRRFAVMPIGVPLPGISAKVVDRSGSESRRHSGELLLGVAACGTRYRNRQELTAERFIESADSAGRWYRTGDLVRRSAGRVRVPFANRSAS